MAPPNFPTSLDALANPTPTTLRNAPGFSLSAQVSMLNDIVEAIEAKLGIGAGGPPGAAAVLRRTATGSSAWQSVVDADVAGAAAIVVSKLAGGGTANTVVRTTDGANMVMGKVTAADIAPGVLTGVPVLLFTSGILAANSVNVAIPSIAQTYSHLELRIYGRSNLAGVSNQVTLRINNDVSGLYFGQTVSSTATTTTATELAPSSTYALVGVVPAATAGSAGAFGAITCVIPNYTYVGAKFMVGTFYYALNNVAGQGAAGTFGDAYWGSAAVTRLDVAPLGASWVPGTIVSLVGWP